MIILMVTVKVWRSKNWIYGTVGWCYYQLAVRAKEKGKRKKNLKGAEAPSLRERSRERRGVVFDPCLVLDPHTHTREGEAGPGGVAGNRPTHSWPFPSPVDG